MELCALLGIKDLYCQQLYEVGLNLKRALTGWGWADFS
jgi:hypothetical protein